MLPAQRVLPLNLVPLCNFAQQAFNQTVCFACDGLDRRMSHRALLVEWKSLIHKVDKVDSRTEKGEALVVMVVTGAAAIVVLVAGLMLFAMLHMRRVLSRIDRPKYV